MPSAYSINSDLKWPLTFEDFARQHEHQLDQLIVFSSERQAYVNGRVLRVMMRMRRAKDARIGTAVAVLAIAVMDALRTEVLVGLRK